MFWSKLFLIGIFSCFSSISFAQPDSTFKCEKQVSRWENVQFTPSVTTYIKYEWDFGDKQFSNAVSPTHMYRTEGYFTAKLCVTDSSGHKSCSEKLVSVVTICVGITPNDFNVDVYPNPCNKKLNILFELKDSSTVSVYVADLSGMVVMELPGKKYYAGKVEIELNTSVLTSGVYFLSIKADDKEVQKKVTKL